MNVKYDRRMRMGISARISGRNEDAMDGLVGDARRAGEHGLEFWLVQLFDIDALTALAVIGREVPELRLGTAVVPIYARHPVVMAMQALTVQAATGNRLTLGVGLSHKMMVEGVFGLSYDKPIAQMREYLEILMSLLHEGKAQHEGREITARTITPMEVAGACAPPVLVAALGTQMLNLAGRLADGTSLWLAGPKTIADHIVPTINRAAEAAGRPRPQVYASLPISVTADPAAAREAAAAEYSWYGTLPSYRAMLDREGAQGPGDVAIVGDEEAVAAQLRHLFEVGTTGFRASVFGTAEEQRRTYALLSELARS
jgi:F420-dependent oxidoreductase-like protein